MQVIISGQRVGITVHTRGTQWHATAEDKDMYAATDNVLNKLDHQAVKHKEKSSTTIKKRAD